MLSNMSLHRLLLALLSLLACSIPLATAVVVPADFTQRLDAFIRCLLSDRSPLPPNLRTPELSIAVVANKQVVFAAGYGQTSNRTPITADTLFGIGSISKAFTSTAAGMLEEQGRLRLSEPIARRVSWRAYDAYVTRETSLRDLLIHHTGVSRQDYIFIIHDTDTDWHAMLEHYVPLLQPALPFRYGYLYNNWMVAQAALAIESIIDTPWSEYITSMLLRPLGMDNTTTTYKESLTRSRATPYTAGRSRAEPPIELPVEADAWADLIAPAGAIHSSANDMSKWMLFQLGAHPRLINASTLDFLHAAQVTVTEPTERFAERGYLTATSPNISAVIVGYGMSWSEIVWNGHAAVTHSGGLLGFISDLWLFPLDDFGFWIGVPAVSGTYFNLMLVWIVSEMLGEYNILDGLCSAESGATEHAAKWSEVEATLEAVFAELDERRQKQSFNQPHPSTSAASASPSPIDSALNRPLHALAPSQLVGTYTDLTGPFGAIDVSLNGDNATHPLLLAWEASRMLLSPFGPADYSAYSGHPLAPTVLSILYPDLPGLVYFDVHEDGSVRGLYFLLGDPVPYLTSKAYAANLSSSTGSNQPPLPYSSSSSTGGNSGGGVVEKDKTVQLVVVLCIVSVVLLGVVAYALLITKRYRELSAAGGVGAPSGSLSESLLSS